MRLSDEDRDAIRRLYGAPVGHGMTLTRALVIGSLIAFVLYWLGGLLGALFS